MDHSLVADLQRCRHLAVYGTLMVGERNHAEYLGAFPMVASGTMLGRLVVVPAPTARHYAYPALLEGSDRVAVDVVELTTPEALASVDQLEFDVDDQGDVEYERVITTIRTTTGAELEAWCYRYRWSVPSEWQTIPSGDWRRRDR